jgi:hypothetical protein
MLGLVIRAAQVPISISVQVLGRGAALAGRVAGWAFAGVQRGLAPDRREDWTAEDVSLTERPSAGRPRDDEEGGGPAAAETGRPLREEPAAIAREKPEGGAVLAGEEEASARTEPQAAPAGEEALVAGTAPEGATDGGEETVEHEPGLGTSVRARSPHSPLSNPVTEPDLTEWPDPYDHREDPRDPGDEMAFGEDAGHTYTGSISTSEPHPSQDPEAEPWEGPKRDKVDQ